MNRDALEAFGKKAKWTKPTFAGSCAFQNNLGRADEIETNTKPSTKTAEKGKSGGH